jgi:hypothetical protein
MLQRKSDLLAAYLFLGVLALGLMFTDVAMRQRLDAPVLEERRGIVRVLALTDLALFTEARYTRHPSMADRNTPFQDHPLSLEHFPSGSILALPPHLQTTATH